MKITVLCENTTYRKDMVAEHGLSLYIETEKHTLLFDMGQTDAFVHNAQRLGVNLGCVDMAVLSHGHYDHGGGMKHFLEINQKAKVYLHRTAFGAHYNGAEKYIGLDLSLCPNDRLVWTDDCLVLDEELSLYSCNDRVPSYPLVPYGLGIKRNGRLCVEDFRHEQYLLINENGKRVLISGCSHKGVQNVARWFTPDVFVGGFHLTKLDPQTEDRLTLQQVAQDLLALPTTYYTGHCTGAAPFAFLKEVMGERLTYLSTGETVVI